MGNKETEREKNRGCTINQVQEPSGAAAYLENAGQKKEDWVDVPAYDPRIPGGDGHTEEEYFSLPDDLRVELIDGVFYAMTSPSRLHQGTASRSQDSLRIVLRRDTEIALYTLRLLMWHLEKIKRLLCSRIYMCIAIRIKTKFPDLTGRLRIL